MNEPCRAAIPALPWQIEWHAELPSTMTRARERAEAGAPAGTVVVADFQSEGRGTHGRTWFALPGACLMFTIVARPKMPINDLPGIPLRVSESIAGFVHDAYSIACTVKPPNDIMVAGRKLCGVLCTSHLAGERIEWLLVGIGLNTHMRDTDLTLESATSLAIAGAIVPAHGDVLEPLLDRLRWLLDMA